MKLYDKLLKNVSLRNVESQSVLRMPLRSSYHHFKLSKAALLRI